MDAVKLAKLLIEEVSAVSDPAHEAPGWIVAKRAERSLTAAIDPPARKSSLCVAWGEGGGFAVTTQASDFISVCRSGRRETVSKASLDPEHLAAGVSADFSSARPAEKHDSARSQMREPDGRWRVTRWRKADPQPKVGGVFFK